MVTCGWISVQKTISGKKFVQKETDIIPRTLNILVLFKTWDLLRDVTDGQIV